MYLDLNSGSTTYYVTLGEFFLMSLNLQHGDNDFSMELLCREKKKSQLPVQYVAHSTGL